MVAPLARFAQSRWTRAPERAWFFPPPASRDESDPMPLTLTIDNVPNLPDGGPVTVTVRGERGIDIGRNASLDWTLPDASRTISGKHCEVRWREGGYWLVDVSTNGTFLNGSEHRMTGPHRLRDGDRLAIGPYLISVAVDGPEAQSRPAAPPPTAADPWAVEGEAPPPIDPRQLRPPPPRAEGGDFLEWAADLPAVAPQRPPRAAQRWVDDSADWTGAPPSAAASPSASGSAPRPAPDKAQSGAPAAAWGAQAHEGDWDAPPGPTPQPRRPAPEPPRPSAAAQPARLIERPPRQDDPFEPLRGGEAASAPFAPSRHGDAARDVYGARGGGPFREPGEAAPRPPVPAPAAGEGPEAFLRRAARAAGLPEDAFAQRGWEEIADEWGELLRAITQNMMQLMQARFEARRITRASHQTLMQALDNNALKFSPTPDHALRLLFGPPTPNYLNAKRAFSSSFDDLKRHQLVTFQAMQTAMAALVQDMSPEAIEASREEDRGLAAMLGSKKARAWDVYTARWNARAMREDDGMLGAFMRYFAQAYDDIDRGA
jgi:type VI secretion system protein ImpI